MRGRSVMDALWWKSQEDGGAACGLCFRGCRIPEGGVGFCGVRFNRGGKLVSPWLGRFCARAVDPIEKKPLAHWRPGSLIYSLGSVGCTMDCPFCQNWQIARPGATVCEGPDSVPVLTPEDLVREVRDLGLDSVALTYNEPTLQAEYILAAAPLLKEAGIALVLVTNGAMSREASEALIPCLGPEGAANIDLKSFTAEGYRKLGGDLETVKGNIAAWVQAGVHVELTCLVVPGISDDEKEFAAMTDWIAALSPDIPLHVSRYFPRRFYSAPPTDVELLRARAEIARGKLRRVHLGNV